MLSSTSTIAIEMLFSRPLIDHFALTRGKTHGTSLTQVVPIPFIFHPRSYYLLNCIKIHSIRSLKSCEMIIHVWYSMWR